MFEFIMYRIHDTDMWGLGISVLPARHNDDDDDNIGIPKHEKHLVTS